MLNFFVQTAYAQTYTLLEPLPGVLPADVGKAAYYTQIYNTILVLTVALAVVMVVVGGIQYSAASLSPSLKAEAKTRILSALGGLMLALFSWLILQTINPSIMAVPKFL